ncbi:MAG: hypothetical protein RR670_06665 [Erysipelotrichaceae bacterium]
MKGNKKKLSKVLLSSTLLLTMFFTTMPTSVFATEKAATPKAGEIAINDTNFPDPVFRGYVTKFDTGKDGSLSTDEREAENAKTIVVNWVEGSGKKINSLKGIEHFTSLIKLHCAGNNLTSLDLSKNKVLDDLDCSSNPLKSFDVSAYSALTQLSCSDISLTKLDVSNNKLLTGLWCDSNNLTSLDVSANTFLKTLSCSSNQLTSLDVSKNTSLVDLLFDGNKLTDIDVSKNTNLHTLFCSKNQLTGLDVSANKALKYFRCFENQLTSLDLSKNTALMNLDCSNQKSTILYDKNKGYQLSAYDAGFVKGNASNFKDATYNDGTLSGVIFGKAITYDYDTGCKIDGLKTPMNVTLTFAGATDASKLDEAKTLAEKAITGISATNETTNKIILDAVTKSVSSIDSVSAAWKAGSPTITLATKDAAGSIKGTIVLTSGSKTMEVTVDKLIEKLTTATPDKPTITVGSGSNHEVNTSNDMTFTCSGRLEDLNGVYVDGKLVAESNYTLKSGSTILTLKSSYLDTLSVGKHILKFQYKDNVAAETDFTITAKTSTPNTGDTSNTMLCFGLMILSGCLAGYSLKKKKALRS